MSYCSKNKKKCQVEPYSISLKKIYFILFKDVLCKISNNLEIIKNMCEMFKIVPPLYFDSFIQIFEGFICKSVKLITKG